MRTDAAARGRGLGARLLEHVLAESARRGYRRVSLETGSQEFFRPARTLYAKYGSASAAVRRLPARPRQRVHDAGARRRPPLRHCEQRAPRDARALPASAPQAISVPRRMPRGRAHPSGRPVRRGDPSAGPTGPAQGRSAATARSTARRRRRPRRHAPRRSLVGSQHPTRVDDAREVAPAPLEHGAARHLVVANDAPVERGA